MSALQNSAMMSGILLVTKKLFFITVSLLSFLYRFFLKLDYDR